MKTNKTFLALTIVLLIALSGQVAMAQSTIFNIPTTDTVAKGSVYAEFDYFGQMPIADGASRLHIFVPRVIVGVGNNFEIGANVAAYHSSGSTNSYFQPNFKYRVYNKDETGVAASAGAILYTPINNRDGQFTSGLIYANLSKKVKTGAYGPRFTAGPYGILIKDEANYSGPKAGAVLGYEQPIHARASIVADWFSGKNGFGYFTPGVSFSLPAAGLLNIGYSIGNDSWENDNATKNRYLFIYYGVTF